MFIQPDEPKTSIGNILRGKCSLSHVSFSSQLFVSFTMVITKVPVPYLIKKKEREREREGLLLFLVDTCTVATYRTL